MSERNDFSTHRTWEDWLGIALGLVIACAPWVVDDIRNGTAVANATVAGIAVVFLSELDLVQFRRWPQIGLLCCGIWVAMSSIVFGYSGGSALRVWHLVAGLAVALLAAFELWQHRDPAK